MRKRLKKSIKLPKFRLEDIEDYYAYYVMILGMSEDIFWNYDISFVHWVAQDKAVYENWIAAARQEEVEKR